MRRLTRERLTGCQVTQASRFEEIVLPHLDAAYNLARWLLRDPVLGEDVVQEAIVRALGHFETYRGGDARAWVLRIVRNAAYDALATRVRQAETPIEAETTDGGLSEAPTLIDPAADPEAALARREQACLLDRALQALPIELRECLVLRELEEMSYREIGRITGVPIGTVMSRLWRARQALLRAGRDAGLSGGGK
ncbi:MAG TPA: sigma-70 family RNA polymerase sigma factor [Acetobacteraceae bacterium]|nr:sigma-70 family RNA polymerase sigma factor [Acetobacteraceae bacterium]